MSRGSIVITWHVVVVSVQLLPTAGMPGTSLLACGRSCKRIVKNNIVFLVQTVNNIIFSVKREKNTYLLACGRSCKKIVKNNIVFRVQMDNNIVFRV